MSGIPTCPKGRCPYRCHPDPNTCVEDVKRERALQEREKAQGQKRTIHRLIENATDRELDTLQKLITAEQEKRAS